MKYVSLFFTLHVILLSYLYTHFWYPAVSTDPQLLEALHLSSCSSVLPLETGGSRCDLIDPPSPLNCRIAFAYSAVKDLVVDSKELLKQYQPGNVADPLVELNSLEDVLANLAYHFHHGIAGEYRIEDALAFQTLLNKAKSGTSLLGGNAAMMALRAARLGCSVGLAAPLSREQIETIPKGVKILTPLVEKPDVHLVVEYQEHQRWGPLVAPRSNRFYLNHDLHMVTLDIAPALHALDLADYDVFAVGGLHLMQNADNSGEVLEGIGKFVKRLKSEGKAVHFEFADVKNTTFYEKLMREVGVSSDSMGLNEQELKTFVTYLASGGVKTGWSSKPSVSDVVAETVDLLRLAKEKNYDVSRVHAHSPFAHVLCSNNRYWDDPEVAVARGALLAGQLACNSTDLDPKEVSLSDQEVVLVKFSGEKMQAKLQESRAVQCWEPEQHYECCVALVPFCLQPRQTRALGDNISGAGLALQRRKEKGK